jgi:predicted nucleotidyltransferase
LQLQLAAHATFAKHLTVSVAELPVEIDREKIAAFCRERGTHRLSVFGSVLPDDFDPQRSDVDVLMELSPDRQPEWEFFRWHEDRTVERMLKDVEVLPASQ